MIQYLSDNLNDFSNTNTAIDVLDDKLDLNIENPGTQFSVTDNGLIAMADDDDLDEDEDDMDEDDLDVDEIEVVETDEVVEEVPTDDDLAIDEDLDDGDLDDDDDDI